MEHMRNKQLVQGLFDATARGEWRPYADALADDVRVTLIGHNSWSRTYEGKAAVFREFWAATMKKLAAPTRLRAHRIVAEGDLVVVEARGDATTVSGQRYANDYCLVLRLRDGKIVEATEYMDTELTTEVLGAREP